MNRDQQKAFTLIELLVVTAVLVVLLSLAVPSFQKLIQSNKDEALRNLLVSQINQTRFNAITNNKQHVLCGSSDGAICDGDWSGYWLLLRAGGENQLLGQQKAPAKNVCWSGFSGKSIRFQSNGTSPTSNGRFTICRANGQHWQLVINRQGRVRQILADTVKSCCTTDHPET